MKAARLLRHLPRNGPIPRTSLIAHLLRRNPPSMIRSLNIHHCTLLLFNKVVGSLASLTFEKTSHRTPECVLGVRPPGQDGALKEDARLKNSQWRHYRYRTLLRPLVRPLYVLGNLFVPERIQRRGDGRNKGPSTFNMISRNHLTENTRSAARIEPSLLPSNVTRRTNDNYSGYGPSFGGIDDQQPTARQHTRLVYLPDIYSTRSAVVIK